MQTLSTEQRTFFEIAVSTYQADLAADTSAQEYLAKRGFSPQDAATFRLGAVSRPLVGHEQYRGRLAIPYLTPSGVVNMNFRCARDHDCKSIEGHRKYLKPEGSSSNLFNVLDLKKDSPFIAVAEGELDTITLSICGIPAVGVAGVKAWEKHFSRCLADFDTIYSFADGDKAGGSFASFLGREVKARPIRLPQGSDVNQIFQEKGADGVRALIAG
jgi:DNA primase